MNETFQWQNKVTLLINTCDAYSDLWEPFFTLLKRYFVPLHMRILLNTESKDFSFEGLPIEMAHSKATTYGGRMRDALAKVQTEYVLLMLDDFFLRTPVDMPQLEQIVSWMDADKNIVYFNTDNPPTVRRDEINRYPGYYRLPRGNRYTLNLQAAVWRTERLSYYWQHDVSPWDWEERCNSLTAAQKKDKFYCAVDEESCFMDYGHRAGQWMGICYGKWVENDVVPLFEKEKITVDFAKRGFCDPKKRPSGLDERTDRATRYRRVINCLGYRYLLPYFIFCRRCNLYTKKHHCAVDEDYFHYLQRKNDLQNTIGKKVWLGPMQE